jgi:hypothetical protein
MKGRVQNEMPSINDLAQARAHRGITLLRRLEWLDSAPKIAGSAE